MEQGKWSIRLARTEDLPDDALQSFNRYQVTEEIRVRKENGYVTRKKHFTDDWDEEMKVEEVRSLRACLDQGGIVSGAFRDGILLGFANVESGLFGRDRTCLRLSSLHVSREARHQGIGKELFHLCCEEARRMGGKRLYISAHSSVETQRFYEACGCVMAKEIDPVQVEKEPCDIQLEFDLSGRD